MCLLAYISGAGVQEGGRAPGARVEERVICAAETGVLLDMGVKFTRKAKQMVATQRERAS